MKHELKIDEQYLDSLLDGSKTFEVRLNDRGYQKGDVLEFHDPRCVQMGAGCRKYLFEITYVHSGLGVRENYVVLAVRSLG